MLKINNLSLAIGKTKILKEISLEFDFNSSLTILGPNGSGKSTFLKCLIGLFPEHSGEIHLSGLSSRKVLGIDRAKVFAYVPQFLEVFADYSVLEFMNLSRFPHMGLYRAISPAESKQAMDILDDLDLILLKNRVLNSLSGGERQRVFIASAIFQESKVLLLDEPTSYLDPAHQEKINMLIAKLRKKMGIIRVSHDINTALLNSERILCLKKGEVFFDGDVKSFLEGRKLNELYNYDFHTNYYEKGGISLIVPKKYI